MDMDKITSEISQKQNEEMKGAIELLNIANCPDCDGSGIIPIQIIKTDTKINKYGEQEPYPIYDIEPSQCRWCFERDLLIKQYKHENNNLQ
jgi:hypothetical protein